MSERRRFFPSTPVQQIPGRTVELEMQLRPEAPVLEPAALAPPPSPPGDCDVVGARWLMSMTASGADAGLEEMAPGVWRRTGESPGFNDYSVWRGTPEPGNEWAGGWEGEGFRCVELHLTLFGWSPIPVIVGVLHGRAMSDARWELSWSHPRTQEPLRSLNGHRAHAAGNMVWVWLLSNIDGSNANEEVLTARAFCGGQPVDELTLGVLSPM